MSFAYIITACFLWGLDPIFRYPLVNGGLSVVGLVFWEHIFMVLFLSRNVSAVYKTFFRNPDVVIWFLLLGILSSGLATLTFTWSLSYLNPSLVILLQKLKTIAGLGLAAVVLGEKASEKFYLWALLAMVGALLISFPHIEAYWNASPEVASEFEEIWVGYLLVGITIIGWGGGTVFARKLMEKGVDSFQLMTGRYSIGLLTLIPIVLFDTAATEINISQFGTVFMMTAISGLLAVFLFYKGLAKVSASVTSVFELFTTFFAVAMSWAVLGHPLSFIQICGALILSGACFLISRTHGA